MFWQVEPDPPEDQGTKLQPWEYETGECTMEYNAYWGIHKPRARWLQRRSTRIIFLFLVSQLIAWGPYLILRFLIG